MKHLRTFESYMSPEKEKETKSYFSEEEDVDMDYDMEEPEEGEGDEAWFSEEEDVVMPEEEEGGHIASFNAYNEGTCPSCNCAKCECGGGMAYEAKKSEKTYKESGLKNPGKADLNDDKKISGYEKARGKAIQKSMETKKGEKPKAQAQKTTKSAQKDEKKKVK